MSKKGCCRECKYSDWDADGCTCMIDGRMVCNASDYTCDQYRPAKPLTNADKIRAMDDEELAEFLRNVQIGALAAQFTNTGIDSEERLRLFLAAIYEEEQE